MDLGLKDRVALVAASSQGLGKAVALGLAREGARLALCARHEPALQAAAEEIRRETGALIRADSTRPGQSPDQRSPALTALKCRGRGGIRPRRYLRGQRRRTAVENLRRNQHGRLAGGRQSQLDEHRLFRQRNAAAHAAAALGPVHRHHLGGGEAARGRADSFQRGALRRQRSVGLRPRTRSPMSTRWAGPRLRC